MSAGARARTLNFGPDWLARRLRALRVQAAPPALCVAFSGGADSTALLAALARMKPAPRALRAIHIDHGLSPHSARWARHCRRLAAALGVPLQVRRVRVSRAHGESLEAAARNARYRVLAAALAPGELLLTAHHLDDQLETVLLQLLRGAGPAGVAAMPQRAALGAGELLRPLLDVPRAQLRDFVRARQLAWVEDESNEALNLDRNYLRAQVLPRLLARWPAAARTLARSAAHMAEAQQLLVALGEADLARARHGDQLAVRVLRTLEPARRRNALRHWIAARGARPPSSARLGEIAGALLAARADRQPLVSWAGARIRCHAGLLSLELTAAAGSSPEGTAPVVEARSWRWQRARRFTLAHGAGTLTLRSDARGPLDLDALPQVVQLRTRSGGERLRPVRGGPRRTLKRLLQEARVPPARRAQLPLVFAGEQLIAAGDLWLDASVQAHAGSARRARLIWSDAD